MNCLVAIVVFTFEVRELYRTTHSFSNVCEDRLHGLELDFYTCANGAKTH